jgi:pyruvate,water dikinase
MLKELKQTKIRIPTGFAVTATAYRKFIKMNGLHSKLEEILRDVDPNDIEGLRKRGKRARELILSSHIPATVKHEITECYEILCRRYSREGLDSETEVDVAVRSSATAEDLPTASFAGQLDSFLNISGTKSVLDAILRCYASLYTFVHWSQRARFVLL